MKAELMAQKRYFESGRTRAVDFRLQQLAILRRGIMRYEAELTEALRADLGKSPFESYASEIGMVLAELRYAEKHLKRWARVRRTGVPLTHFPARGRIYAEPYGAVLVIAPWNYPFQLAAEPLIAAMAAGNCVTIKPSEYAPHTASVLAKLVRELFDPAYIRVECGDAETSKALLGEPFDFIFFTGSSSVGKLVMQAAAEHLTPVALELGGKSPCIADETADIRAAARRIAWGKTLNAGQTCVAPDYVLVQESVREELVRELGKAVREMYGTAPIQNADYPKIIRTAHWERLCGLMDGCEILFGGGTDAAAQKIEPTLLGGVTWDSPIMQEEIFGPLLPILTFRHLEEAVEIVQSHPHPLALYVFSENKKNVRRLTEELTFGGACVNDTLMHMTLPQLPFGGAGQSGMGAYHGKAGFDAFSHPKSVLMRGMHPDIPLRYPPYEGKLTLLKKLLR